MHARFPNRFAAPAKPYLSRRLKRYSTIITTIGDKSILILILLLRDIRLRSLLVGIKRGSETCIMNLMGAESLFTTNNSQITLSRIMASIA